ncbi:MAG: hypothetical protein CVV30_11290 [Methanomicrobiales archaeon HGW-Methanomicrobiales-1]|jgi:hypothetical protein|nr:MAG: hypothetical protein CVV30_11290 [Methanomicrobiales archaeon HGW-Methanomicrobiales-1]
MKEDTRWKLLAAIGLVTLSLALYTLHYLLFNDLHHVFIYFVGDLAFIPIEVLVVTLIIDQMLESREKQRRMEKLNMVIGTFFSTIGTPLLAQLSRADTAIGNVKGRLVIGADWHNEQFKDVRGCLENHTCSVVVDHVDMDSLRDFLVSKEDFLLRLVENPMVFEHETFTDLILGISHLTEEMKARGDLATLPPSDRSHLETDIGRVYSQLIPEWLKYMEYLKIHYPYLFSLAIRKNPFDESASVIVRQTS